MLYVIPLLTLGVTAAGAPPPVKADAYYHFSLGIRARLLRDERTALDELRKAQNADPASGDVRAEIARLLRDSGRMEEALTEAQEAVRVEPTSVTAQAVLAQTYYLSSTSNESSDAMLDKAAEAFEQVVKLSARDVEALATLADIYRRRQAHDKAIATWVRLLEIVPGNAEGYLQLGQHHLALGHADEATAAFNRAVDLQPSSQAFQSLAAIYLQAQRTDEAADYYRKALALEPKNLLVRLRLAETLLRARRLQDSLAETEQALKLDANNRFALDLKAQALRDLHDFAGADAVASALVARDPRDPDAAFLRITILEARHEWPAAVAALEAALARPRQNEDPEQRGRHDRRLWVHLGAARQETGAYAEAAKAFAQASALSREPDSAMAAWEIQAWMRAKDLNAAAARVATAREHFPDQPELIALDATIRRERGETAVATAMIEKLRTTGDRDVATLIEVADFYRRGRRYTEAESVLRRARELEPRDARILFQLGAVLERQGRPDDAEVLFRELLASKPEFAPALNYLGYMNANRGVRLEEALRLIEQALALDPESGAYLDSLGWAHFRLGRVEQAEQLLRRAVAKLGRNAVVLDHLGDVLKRRGQLREAVGFWEQALAGNDDEDELDQAAVKVKIREAQARLADPAPVR